MKQLFTFACFALLFTSIYSQSSTISGTLTDTINTPLISATVLLLEKDSTLLEYTQTETDGSFQFKRIGKGDYLIKSTYLGYIPLTLPVNVKAENIDLGKLKMTEISTDLYEVVIKAAKAPMTIRGDTIEYDATTFKVPDGSTLEDLLKRLPGVEVQQDGSIRADGKDVTKVTVDGKSFFGGDPKTATKNLPAEGVSKVQVFDNKTEEQKIVGDNSSSKEKAMNITLKDEYKKGGFGKVIAGLGDASTKELKGNFNRFNEKHQFSLVGVGNNTGRNGLGWEDYQGFMGSQSWNFTGNTEYGFGGGFTRYYYFSEGNNDGLENSISNAFYSGSGRGGFPENLNGGVNYNYEHNKKKFAATYFYNFSGNERTTTSNITNFTNEFTSTINKVSENEDDLKGHRAEIKYEHEIDSFNTIVFNSKFTDIHSTQITKSISNNISNRERIETNSDGLNSRLFEGSLLSNSLLYRKTFKKKARFFGANVSYVKTNVTEDNDINNFLEFYNSAGSLDSTRQIDQDNNNVAEKDAYKFNVTYNEPISKSIGASVFYNWSKREQVGDVMVFDKLGTETNIQNTTLSRNYVNTIDYNRVGMSLRYSKDGINVTTGLAQQRFNITGNVKRVIDSGNVVVERDYNTLIPYTSVDIDLSRNSSISMSYVKNVAEPRIEDLLPIIDNRNPLYVIEGNPNLLPTNSNVLNFWFSHAWPADGIRISTSFDLTHMYNQTILDQTINENSFTYIKPVNYDGGSSFSMNGYFSFPIIKNKLKSNLGVNNSINNSFSIVNTVLNETKTNSLRPRVNLDFTPSDNFAIYLYTSMGKTTTEYNINTSQNQVINRKDMNLQCNVGFGKGFYLASSYNHSFYKNETTNISEDIPIINASVYKQFLKGNKGEIRLSVYDALNENRQFNQSTSAISVSQVSTPSLARYFMLSFTYNIKGLTGKVQRENY